MSFATIQRDLAGERAKSSPKRKCHPRCDNGRIAHRSLPGWFKRCEGCNSPDLGRAAHRLARGLGLNCQTLDCGYALFIPNRAPMSAPSAQQVIDLCTEYANAGEVKATAGK